MIKLIVGLGNPGQQYEKNRHNAGFLFLDRLAFRLNSPWVKESKFQGWFSKAKIDEQDLLLLKPNTFMNLSGQAVGKVARYYKLLPEEILVVHDELDFNAGVVKLKKGGGHAGHNGLRDIIAHLGNKDFYRLRIGIGRPQADSSVANYVLSDPSKAEMDLLEAAFVKVEDVLKTLIGGDMNFAMNILH